MYRMAEEKISRFISPVTDGIINSFIDEIKKKRNKEKIMRNIIEPILNDINSKYYPHVITLIVFLSVIIILLTLLLIVNIKKIKCTVNDSIK